MISAVDVDHDWSPTHPNIFLEVLLHHFCLDHGHSRIDLHVGMTPRRNRRIQWGKRRNKQIYGDEKRDKQEKTKNLIKLAYPDNQIKICCGLPRPNAIRRRRNVPKVRAMFAHKKNHVPANQSFAKCFTTHMWAPNNFILRGRIMFSYSWESNETVSSETLPRTAVIRYLIWRITGCNKQIASQNENRGANGTKEIKRIGLNHEKYQHIRYKWYSTKQKHPST